MPAIDTPQLSFDFTREKRSSDGLFYATRVLRKHRLCNHVMRRLHYVRRFFPEFGDRQIRVGLTRAASGMAVPGGSEVWLNPNTSSYHTIAHEFIHLLQGTNGIPSGERSCDVFSLARDWTLNDAAPYYVRVPRRFIDSNGKIQPEHARLIYRVACDALERRAAGRRNYISYFESSIASCRFAATSMF